MLDLIRKPLETFGDFFQLSGEAYKNVLRRPHYTDDIAIQMDIIGVGSLSIVILTGFFSGAVMTMQLARGLEPYGATGQVGQVVAIAIVRELGPVLSSVVVAGRNSSGMASEIGSMVVTEQVDAMRALGTDPNQKLVTPRLIATAVVLPLLTIIADFVALFGGFLIAYFSLNLTPTQFWKTAYQALVWGDLAQGLLKPFAFAQVIALVGCYYGMRTRGGTQGVGRATTQAVVVSNIWIFVLTLFITRIFVTR